MAAFESRFTFGGGGIQYGHGISGSGDLRKNLAKLIREMPKDAARAAFEEWMIEKYESMKITPWKTKTLMKSHRVLKPEIVRGRIFSGITVGNEATENYAIPVHEDLEMNHPHGEAKFLEKTVRASARYMAQRIANRMDLRRIVATNVPIVLPEDPGTDVV
jgi:hypothetical protein